LKPAQLQYAWQWTACCPRSGADERGNFRNTLDWYVRSPSLHWLFPFDDLWDLVDFGVLMSFNLTNGFLLICVLRGKKLFPSCSMCTWLSCLVVFSAGRLRFTQFYPKCPFRCHHWTT
jgi:hypothetical protein